MLVAYCPKIQKNCRGHVEKMSNFSWINIILSCNLPVFTNPLEKALYLGYI